MRPTLPSLVALALLATPSLAQTNTYYAYGSFCSTCQTATVANQFYDDGLHDDGAAGDDLFGAIVTVDKPAGSYYWGAATDVYGGLGCVAPQCWCLIGYDPSAYLWTSGPGDVIHFRLGLATDPSWGGQWISAGPHGIPPGNHLAVTYGPFPGWCDYPVAGTGYPAQLNGTYWERVVTIPTPGTYSMRFQTLEASGRGGDPVWFSEPYNAMCCAFGDCPRYVRFATTRPNSDVLFQFDITNGRMRGIELGQTPTRTPSWGAIKTLYR
jgi:hypothetical protein